MQNLLKKYVLFAVLVWVSLLTWVIPAVHAQTNESEIMDVVLVLEASKGENEAEKITQCESAAKMFIDMLPSRNTRVSIVSYGRSWPEYTFASEPLAYLNTALGRTARSRICLIQPPTMLEDDADRENVKNRISDLYAEIRQAQDISYTYLGGGLMASMDVLYQLPSRNGAVVVVSDGRISGFTASPYSNYELVGMAAETAEQNGWKLYALETNDNGENSPTSMARSVMYQLIRNRSHHYEMTSFDMSSFAVNDADILADFMKADTVGQNLTLSGSGSSFTLSVPEAVSETDILITGGRIDSVEIDGIACPVSESLSAGNEQSQIQFIRNQNSQYSIIRLSAYPSGQHTFTVYGTVRTPLQIDILHYYDLPLSIQLSSCDTVVGGTTSITRNNTVNIDIALTDNRGSHVEEPTFYRQYPIEIRMTERATGQSRILTYTADSSGYHTSVNLTNPAEYDITASLSADMLRTGSASDSASLTVENYVMEVTLDGHEADGAVTCDEILTVQSYFTDVLRGRLTDSDIYREKEAVLNIYRDGKKIAENLPMSAAADGYFYEYTPEVTGEYRFEVVCRAACFDGIPSSMTKQSIDYRCLDYTLQSDWKIKKADNTLSDYPDNGSLMKNDILTVRTKLLSHDGKPLTDCEYYRDGSISLHISRGRTVIDTIPMHYEAEGVFSAEWLVHNAGELTLTVQVNDTVGQSEQKNAVVMNHAPTLLQSEYKAKYAVGEAWQIQLSDYVTDTDGDYMEISVVGLKSEEEKSDFQWSLSDDYQTIYLSAGNYKTVLSFVFRFYDGDDSVELPAKITVTNEKPQKLKSIEFPHFLLEAWKIYEWIFGECPDEPVTLSLADYFADPEGLPLTFTVTTEDGVADSIVSYDSERSLLTVVPSEAISTKIHLTVTDSSEESVSVVIPLQIDIWWKFYFRQIVIVLTIAALLLLAAVLYMLKNGMIGRLQIREGSYFNPSVNAVQKIDIDEHINRKNNKKSHQKISVFLSQRILNSDIRNYLKEHETGTLTGHLIFGSSVYLRNCQATDITDYYGQSVTKKKKIKLLAGRSYILHYENGLTIRIANRNVGRRKRRRRRLF